MEVEASNAEAPLNRLPEPSVSVGEERWTVVVEYSRDGAGAGGGVVRQTVVVTMKREGKKKRK